MDRDQPPGVEVGIGALVLEEAEGPHLPALDLEGHRLRHRLAGIRKQEGRWPGLRIEPAAFSHLAAPELLVARAGLGGVDVTRADEAEAKAPGSSPIVEAADGRHVLRRAGGAIVEGGLKTIAALPRVQP